MSCGDGRAVALGYAPPMDRPEETMKGLRVMLAACLVWTGSAMGAVLEPEQAFRVWAVRDGLDAVVIDLQIAPGHALYVDKLGVEGVDDGGFVVEHVDLPRGGLEHGQPGDRETLREYARIRVTGTGSIEGSVWVSLKMQGCSDEGICFLPMNLMVEAREG